MENQRENELIGGYGILIHLTHGKTKILQNWRESELYCSTSLDMHFFLYNIISQHEFKSPSSMIHFTSYTRPMSRTPFVLDQWKKPEHSKPLQQYASVFASGPVSSLQPLKMWHLLLKMWNPVLLQRELHRPGRESAVMVTY